MLPRYILESHKSKNDAASAFSATIFTRALLSAVFPLFTQQMFENLSTNVAASILAAIATASCLLPIILINFGAKLRGSSSSGGIDDDDDGDAGREVPVEKKSKPKKTVRWGDETDSSTDGSETNSEDPTVGGASSPGSSEMPVPETETGTGTKGQSDGYEFPNLSRLATQIDRRDSADPAVSPVETETETGDEDGVARVEGVETQERERGGGRSETAGVERVETKGLGPVSASGSGAEDGKRKKKEMTRIDDGDDGAAGSLGLGLDVERLAVFPYF